MTRVALRSLSLCAGIGGIDLGLARWCRTVCYVEREAFAAAVLVARMEEAALDSAPVWDDLKTFDGRPWRGRVDLVTGGYPCQPFSLAGARQGSDDPRHLWPHVRRIVEEVQPPLVFFENVAGHVSLGLGEVVRDLEGMGYRVAATLVTAEEVGAPHRRERVFIMGHANCERLEGSQFQRLRNSIKSEYCNTGSAVAHPERDILRHESGRCGGSDGSGQGKSGDAREDMEHAPGERCGVRGGAHERPAWPPGPADADGWRLVPEDSQPAIRRVVDGLPEELVTAGAFRQDRLRALGNAVVPACATAAFRILLGALFVE